MATKHEVKQERLVRGREAIDVKRFAGKAKRQPVQPKPRAKRTEALPPLPKKLGTIPKNLAAAADLYYIVRQNRLAKEKEAEPLKTFESELREHIVNTLPKSKLGGVAGKVVRVTIGEKEIPVVKDEKAFFNYAKRKGNEDLLVTRANTKAIEARWEDNKKIPGVGVFKAVTLSVNKL